MKILVISAHPDDETLGCGGTLLKHRAAGDHLYWAIATQLPSSSDPGLRRKKEKEVEAVARAYGIKRYFRLGFPTTRLDQTPLSDLIDSLRAVFVKVKPEIVYLLHHGDVHSDHRALFEAAMSVLKPMYMSAYHTRKILSYETLSSTEAAPQKPASAFIPNLYNDITPHLEKKLKVMGLYQSEAHKDPLPRGPSAIRALARFRGASIGVPYAEAFALVREIAR